MKVKDVKIEEIQHSCTYQSMITRKVRILAEEPANGSISGRRLLHKRNAGHQIHSKDHEANCSHSLVQNVRDEGCSMIAQTSHLINENLTSPSSGSSKELPVCLHGEFRYVIGKSEFTQEVVRSLEARDDDDNVSVLPEATSTLLFGEALHPFQPPFTGSESKIFQNCDSHDKGGDCMCNHRRQHTKFCKSSLVSGSCNESSGLKSSDSDEMPSLATTKLTWNANKFNEPQDSPKFKVNITSFIVPELSIDLPETATVANLKKAVMDATLRLLGGGLHIHVLHEGRRVSDESRKLLEMGIACDEDLNSLAFMLKPNQSPNAESTAVPLLCLSNVGNQHRKRYPFLSLRKHTQANTKSIRSGRECLQQPGTRPLRSEQETGDDRGIVAESVSAFVLHTGTKDSKIAGMINRQQNIAGGKRRIRRPFTVTEVEALVNAVETLGTGRWREIKKLAFEQASCRTYTDLKDKWKTLVRTAQIAPQQRRGESVPQDLLDRVLTTHNYWMEHRAKPIDRHPLVDKSLLRTVSINQNPVEFYA